MAGSQPGRELEERKGRELEERKEVANVFMKSGKLELARDIYYSILLDIESTIDDTSSYQDIQIACLNNLSALFYQTGNYSEVLQLTSRTLSLQPSNVKALYRQAQAYEKLNLPSVAIEKISALLDLEPSNKQGKEYLMKLMEGNQILLESGSEGDVKSASKGEELSHEESQSETEKPESIFQSTPSLSNQLDSTVEATSLPPEYGFMNTSWLAQTPPPALSLSSPPIPSSSHISEELAQTFQSEVEKNKIKNSIFQSALSTLQTTSHHYQSHSSKSPSNISTSQRVKSTLHELQLEEEKLKHQQKSKVDSREQIPEGTIDRKKKSTPSSVSSSLKSKKVISKTAQDEWAMLMREEEQMKQLVEEKKPKSSKKR